MNEHTHDAARPDAFEALKAELATVSVSPDFAKTVRARLERERDEHERHEDALALVGYELSSVSVSPEFAVRVRQQIEALSVRSRWFVFFDWRWAVPVAAAAVVVAAIALSRGWNPDAPAVDPTGVTARGSQVPPLPPAVGPGRLNPPASSDVPAAHAASQTVPVRASQRTSTRTAASGQQAEDKFEVITYQPAVYRQLWAAAAAATVVEAADLPIEVRALALAVVEVKPVVVPWLVEPPVGSGGSVPDIRRVSAAAERSDK